MNLDLLRDEDKNDLVVDEQLNLFEESDEHAPQRSITVQVVLMHPYNVNTIYWVLNKEEIIVASQHYHGPKPPGWGNPGGSIETVDETDQNGAIRSFEETLVAAAKREVEHETGFVNLDFIPDLQNKLEFLRYVYDTGHTVITLAARLRDFKQELVLGKDGTWHVREIEEIDRGRWFDLSLSCTELFEHEQCLPYRSHIRRTVIVLQRINRGYSRIHPLWKAVFTSSRVEDIQSPMRGNNKVSASAPTPVAAHANDEKKQKRQMPMTEEEYDKNYERWWIEEGSKKE